MVQKLNSLENRTGMLTIDGVSMHTSGWSVLNNLPLWVGAPARGDNLIIPGSFGTLAKRYRQGERSVSLPMVFDGWFSGEDDTPFADPWEGLQFNIGLIRDNVVAPPAAPAVSRSASLLMPDGSELTADIQVLQLEIGDNLKTQVRATLDIRIPIGRFS